MWILLCALGADSIQAVSWCVKRIAALPWASGWQRTILLLLLFGIRVAGTLNASHPLTLYLFFIHYSTGTRKKRGGKAHRLVEAIKRGCVFVLKRVSLIRPRTQFIGYRLGFPGQILHRLE